jgi:hypothetical protein
MEHSLKTFSEFIQSVGFPIAVAAFVLVRLNGKLQKLVEAVDRLTDRIDLLLKVELTRKEE